VSDDETHNGRDISALQGKDWSNKDVTLLLISDVHRRFDGVDQALQDVREGLRNTATKDDVSEVHKRIDGVEKQIEPLQAESDAQKAIEANRAKFRSAVIRTATLVASLAVVGGFIWSILVAVH
jgi:hypothetical protein